MHLGFAGAKRLTKPLDAKLGSVTNRTLVRSSGQSMILAELHENYQ